MAVTYRNAEHYYDPTAGMAISRVECRAEEDKTMKKILAIDPGTYESGWVLVEHDGAEIRRILGKGKTANEEILHQLYYRVGVCDVVVEMVASYGMPVGKEVFDTCVWIGRFLQAAAILPEHTAEHLIYRKDEKLDLCGTLKANDATIHQALVDRYAYGQPNKGKGTKAHPGFFYGMSKDAWAAMAVAVTWLDKRKEG